MKEDKASGKINDSRNQDLDKKKMQLSRFDVHKTLCWIVLCNEEN